MSKCDKYSKFFTKEYMMGPNSLRLLDEILSENPDAVTGGRLLDLGCGEALTSIFAANETAADEVYALDLWISASDNYERIKANGLDGRIVPVHANIMDKPFADGFFDAAICIDAFHYFGCEDGVFVENVLPLIKSGGHILISVPGVKREVSAFDDKQKALMTEWVEEDAKCFHSVDWWKSHIEKQCGDTVEVACYEGKCFDEAWNDWFASGNEFGERDKEFLERGLGDLLTFVMIVVKKK